jgi:hypothetical protein
MLDGARFRQWAGINTIAWRRGCIILLRSLMVCALRASPLPYPMPTASCSRTLSPNLVCFHSLNNGLRATCSRRSVVTAANPAPHLSQRRTRSGAPISTLPGTVVVPHLSQRWTRSGAPVRTLPGTVAQHLAVEAARTQPTCGGAVARREAIETLPPEVHRHWPATPNSGQEGVRKGERGGRAA